MGPFLVGQGPNSMYSVADNRSKTAETVDDSSESLVGKDS